MAGLFSALRAEVALPAEQNREELREGEWRVSKRQKGGSEYVSRFPMQASHPILQSTVAYLHQYFLQRYLFSAVDYSVYLKQSRLASVTTSHVTYLPGKQGQRRRQRQGLRQG
jgi:hypothetical protein